MVALALMASLTTLACGDADREARFDVDGIQKFGPCIRSAFPMEPTFLATKKRIDSVGIFLQTQTALGPEGDLVYFEVYDHDRIADNPGRDVPFEYPPRTAPPVRGKLATWGSCPDTNVSLAIEGTIRFDEFGTESTDRMVGELVDGTIVDARTCEVDEGDDCEVVAERITGSWNFPVEVTAPHRSYPTFEDEYRVEP